MEKLVKDSHGVEDHNLSDEMKELLLSIPKEKNFDSTYLYQYDGFWYRSMYLAGMISSQKQFQAQGDDIILITCPKSGTTWLKALTYAIVHRFHYAMFDSNNPLLTKNPHDLVPFLDLAYYPKNHSPSFAHFPTPRILGTHIPYSSLPPSIVNSKCRIVYMCRNPLDQFISYWHFLSMTAQDLKREPLSLEEAFEMACHGIQEFGPLWEHVLGYWKASLDNSQRILFLKYEDVKEDVSFHIKKLADFLGCPFSEVEENKGAIEEISKLCSFGNMKDLEVNKTGRFLGDRFKNSRYFRKGKVGDWENYLSPSMSERLKNLMEEKLSGSGLTFRMSPSRVEA